MSDIPFTEWLCKQCDDTECRFSVNANLCLIRPVRCPLDTWAVNPQSIFERVNHIDQQIQKEQWCGDCGFKGSDTCNDGMTWKRCRLMSSEPEGKNVEDRLELARNSAMEKVLDKLEQLLCAHHKYVGSYRIIIGTPEEIYDELFDAMQDIRKNGLVNK